MAPESMQFFSDFVLKAENILRTAEKNGHKKLVASPAWKRYGAFLAHNFMILSGFAAIITLGLALIQFRAAALKRPLWCIIVCIASRLARYALYQITPKSVLFSKTIQNLSDLKTTNFQTSFPACNKAYKVFESVWNELFSQKRVDFVRNSHLTQLDLTPVALPLIRQNVTRLVLVLRISCFDVAHPYEINKQIDYAQSLVPHAGLPADLVLKITDFLKKLKNLSSSKKEQFLPEVQTLKDLDFLIETPDLDQAIEILSERHKNFQTF